jgi:hypothetical protein
MPGSAQSLATSAFAFSFRPAVGSEPLIEPAHLLWRCQPQAAARFKREPDGHSSSPWRTL